MLRGSGVSAKLERPEGGRWSGRDTSCGTVVLQRSLVLSSGPKRQKRTRVGLLCFVELCCNWGSFSVAMCTNVYRCVQRQFSFAQGVGCECEAGASRGGRWSCRDTTNMRDACEKSDAFFVTILQGWVYKTQQTCEMHHDRLMFSLSQYCKDGFTKHNSEMHASNQTLSL